MGLEVVAIWALSAFGVYQMLSMGLGAMSRRRYRKTSIGDPANQLRYVMEAEFAPRRVMNRSEYQVFRTIEAAVARLGGGRRVFSQTALGEILSSPHDLAFRSINAKRADILVVGPDGMPQLVVEYQGAGHYQGNAAARDAVKREALRRAGVAYLEVFADHSSAEVAQLAMRALGVNAQNATDASLGMSKNPLPWGIAAS